MGTPSILRNPRTRRAGLAAGALFIVIGILGFLVAPRVIKPALETALAEKLHRTVSIREVSVNPYALSVTIKGFVLNERDGTSPALAFDELYVNLEAESLLRQAPVVGEIKLVGPALKVVRNADKGYNFGDLIEEFMNAPDSGPQARFSINNIQVSGGRIDFNDVPQGKQHTIDGIRLGVPFVSNLPSKVDIHVEPSFSARLDGSPVALDGQVLPFQADREASINLNLDGLNLPKYLDYSPVPLAFKLPSGVLDTKLVATFRMPKEQPMSLGLAGTVGLGNFEMADAAGRPLLKLPVLNVAIRSLDLFGNKLALDSVVFDRPEITLTRDKGGVVNFASLLPGQPSKAAAGKGTAEAKKTPSPPLEFAIGEIKLANGRLGLVDELPKRPFQTRLEDISLTVRQLSSGNAPANVEISLKTDSGERIDHRGQVTLSPFAAQGELSLGAVKLKNYSPYFGPFIRFNVEDGSLDGSAAYALTANEGKFQIQVNDGKIALTGLRLRQPDDKRPFFTLDRLLAQGMAVDLDKREVAVGELSTDGGKLLVKRDKAGVFNLTQLLAEGSAAKSTGKTATGTPWRVSLGKLAVDGYGVRVEDQKTAGSIPFVADPVALAADNLSTAGKAVSKVGFKAAIGKRGRLDLTGTLAPQPLQARFKLDLQRVDLVPLQPYFQDKLNVTVTRGAASARGILAANQTRGGEVNASYRGDASLGDFALIDNPTSSDLLKWKSLHFSGIEFDLLPLKIAIGGISLSDFYSRVILSPEGKLNLAQIVNDPGTAATAAPASPPPSVKIGRVTVQGGNIRFTDNFIKPNYTADMVNIGGAVAGLSSEPGTTADVDLRGDLNNAPLQIAGKVNPLASEIQLDLKAGVRGMELAPLSPYSGKYAGYAIEKGKLTVDVRYFIENRKLQAENHLFLDQLTFGDRVESPDATKLPVLLAVALLKNRRGEIDINLPVNGALDDPQFSVGGIVIQVIVNLVVKAVTSPFALLGSMFGGGEDLAYIEFDSGRADIGPAAETKLKTLAKALADRPALKIDIAGRIDPATDAEGVRRVQMERKVKAQKLRETVKKGEDAASVGEVALSSEEYPRYLKLAYKDEKFTKPRNLIGFAKDLPPEEMEKLMLANAQVGNEDLRALADQRALTIKEWLLKAGQIPPERVFIVSSKLSAEEIKDKGKASRVDLSLK